MSKLAKYKSTWTPLSNGQMNEKIYSERRELMNKWFAKWNEEQRLQIIEDLIGQMKVRQIARTRDMLLKRKNFFHEDFTRCLPRVISIYVFSFLDPRSLSRCAQVCWHWKWISELDQLWMKKCLRLGWLVPSQRPGHQDSMGSWKRYYIENMTAFKATVQLTAMRLSARDRTENGGGPMLMTERPKRSSANKRPPWKGSDPTPRDTWRNNYLDNEDEVEKYNRTRKIGMYGYVLNDIQKSLGARLLTDPKIIS